MRRGFNSSPPVHKLLVDTHLPTPYTLKTLITFGFRYKMGLLKSLSRYILVAAVFLFPLFFLPITQEFFVTQKFYLILVAGLISLTLIGVIILATKRLHTLNTPFIRILVALLVVNGVSVFFASTNRLQALYSLPNGLLPLVSGILIFLSGLYVYAETKKELPVKQALGLGGTLAALVSVFFYFNPFASAALPESLAFLKNQQFSLLGNVFDSALFFGFLVVGGIASFFSGEIRKSITAHMPRLISLLVAAIALGMMITFLLKPGAANQESFRLPPFGASWNAVVETLKQPKTALIGVGLDNFDVLFTATKSPSYNASPNWQVNYELSRSALLHIWAETGLLGLITMLLLILYVIREVHGLLSSKDPDGLMFALLGAYLGILILFFPPSYIVLMLMFFYLLALAQRALHNDKDSIKTINLSHMPMAYVSLFVLAMAVAIGSGYFVQQAYASEMYFKKSIDAIRSNNGRDVYTNLQQAVQRAPYNEKFRNQFAQVNLLLANNLAQQKDLSDDQRRAAGQFIQQSIAEAKALVSLNPNRASNWNTLAVIYRNIINVAQGADAWTIASYQEAIKHDPVNPLLHLNLGGVFYGAKNYEGSTKSFERAVSLKPDWANAHYNYAWSLFQEGKTAPAVAVMQNVLTLLDEKSEDYKTAQTNYDVFKEKLDAEASEAAKLKPELQAPTDSNATQSPLQLPGSPAPQLSPAIDLPESSAPDVSPQAQPSAAPSEVPAQ